MKAPHRSVSRIMRISTGLMALICLCQCSMPPRESWHYIKSNGLLAYLNQPSPPFGAAYSRNSNSLAMPRYTSASQRYAAPRYGDRSASSLYHRIPYNSYYSASPYQSRYQQPVPSRPNVATVPLRPSPRPRVERSSPSPRVKIPVDEPSEPTKVANSVPPVHSPAPKTNTPLSSTSHADLPFGTPVPGRVNMVNSPYAGKTQLVDVSGMGPGQTVKCPYTGKLFKVPSSQQAANSAEPRLESKAEKPKLSPEPSTEDKKP